jgi:hypothetical protein
MDLFIYICRLHLMEIPKLRRGGPTSQTMKINIENRADNGANIKQHARELSRFWKETRE